MFILSEDLLKKNIWNYFIMVIRIYFRKGVHCTLANNSENTAVGKINTTFFFFFPVLLYNKDRLFRKKM